MDIFQESLELHGKLRGKLEVSSKVKVENQKDLSLAYSPGVAESCREIHKDKANVYKYTSSPLLFLPNNLLIFTPPLCKKSKLGKPYLERKILWEQGAL